MSDSDWEVFKELLRWLEEGKVSPETKGNQLPSPAFDPVRHRLDTERNLAYIAVGALVGFLLLDFIVSVAGFASRVDGFMRIAIPVLTGATGTAFGYYFGKK